MLRTSLGSVLFAMLTACAAPSAQNVAIAPGVADGIGLEADCRPYPQPSTVEELDRLASEYLGHPGFQGGDGAMTIELSDGRWLSLFGDTLREKSYPGGSFVRNSMMLFSAGDACVITGPWGGEVIADRGDGVGYWPMSAVSRTSGGVDEVAIMMQRVATTASDDLGFVILGTSLVRLQVPHAGVPRLVDTIDLQADDPSRSRITWGAAMWRGEDEWIYLYGTQNPQRVDVFGWSLHPARARWGDLGQPERWQFWDGDVWSPQQSDVTTLIDADGGVAQVLSVFSRDNTWFAVSTKDGDLGDDVAVWTAPLPTGPFTAHPSVLSLPTGQFDGALTYLVLAHPRLFEEPGTVVISYSRGAIDGETLVAQPLRYRPAFVRIPLPD